MPSVFFEMLNDDEHFIKILSAYIFGLKGAYKQPKGHELEKRRKEYNEAERIGLTVEEYRRMLEIEEQDLINNIRNNMLKVGIGI